MPAANKAWLLAALFCLAAFPAAADCVCRCVDGAMRAICSSSTDLQPVCPAVICPMAPLGSNKPFDPPAIPPPGMTRCEQAQVLNLATLRYEWQQVCR